MPSQLPSGTVSFLFTELEGSTQLSQKHPDQMNKALARHDALLREALEAIGGWIFPKGGIEPGEAPSTYDSRRGWRTSSNG